MVPHLHSSTTTPAKSSHYTQALSGALVAGSWGDKQPVKQPNGSTLLDWSEGIRKWGKHSGGGGCGLALVLVLGYGSGVSMVGMRKLTSSIPFLLSFGCRYGLPGAVEKRLASLPFLPTTWNFELCPFSSNTISYTTVFLDLYLCSRCRSRSVYHLARKRYRYDDLGSAFLGIRSVKRDHPYHHHDEYEHDPFVHLDTPVAD
jgi:hypothetical protein